MRCCCFFFFTTLGLDDVCLFSAVCRSSFRQGLVSGEKYIIYPILEWCLLKLPDLKKRAYLARYLVKVEIPGDILTDPELDVMYKQVSRSTSLCSGVPPRHGLTAK